MAQELTEPEVVSCIQRSLLEESWAVAYFTRDRYYSYYTFNSIHDLIELMRKRNADSIAIDEKDPSRITFSMDEWFVFASQEKAAQAFKMIRVAFPEGFVDDD